MVRLRRVLRYLCLVLASCGGVVLAWFAAHMVLAAPRPVPLFTANDVAPLPPEASNGWSAARSVPSSVLDPHTLRLFVAIVGTPVQWAALERHADTLREVMDLPAVRSSLATYEAALQSPFFVDACRVEVVGSCYAVPLRETHRLESFAIVRQALDGEHAAAATRLAVLLRADAAWVASARTDISQLLACEAARSSVALSNTLAPRLDADAAARLQQQLTQLVEAKVDRARPIVIAYLEQMALTEQVAEGSEHVFMHPLADADADDADDVFVAPASLRNFLSRRLLDRGRTEQLLADNARQRLHALQDSSAPTSELAADVGWLTYNAAGKRIAGAASLGVPPERVRAECDPLRDEAAAAVAVLASRRSTLAGAR